MKKIFAGLFLLFIFVLKSYAQPVGDILKDSVQFDCRQVEITGEAIGGVIHSGDGWWVNILDHDAAIGLFCYERNFFDSIERFGGYNSYGDIVRAEGVFYANCREHGETDIHITRLTVIKPGVVRQHAVDKKNIQTGTVMLAIFFIAVFIYWKNYNTIHAIKPIKSYAAGNRKAKKRI